MTLGLLSFGCIALGVLAFGAIAVGIIAVGALSVGLFSVGALALGAYFAVGDAARGDVAIGITEASGALFQTVKVLTDGHREAIRSVLDQSVPWIWRWAMKLVLSFL